MLTSAQAVKNGKKKQSQHKRQHLFEFQKVQYIIFKKTFSFIIP